MPPRAQAKGLEIRPSYVDERLPSRVIGDAGAALRQVLFNLAGNAIKFTESGGVSIIVEPSAQPDAIAIAVRPTPASVSRCRIRRASFWEFEQADVLSTRKFGGTGLGLTISNKIIESMWRLDHGREAAPATASTFRVNVPLPRADDAQEPALMVPDLAGSDVLIRRAGADRSVLDRPAPATLGRAHQNRPGRRSRSPLLLLLGADVERGAGRDDHALGTGASEALARAAVSVPRRTAPAAAGHAVDAQRACVQLVLPASPAI